MTARAAHALNHRRHVLWLAALVHRLSGIGLAVFLPLHFLALGLAINGDASLDRFLRWTEQPIVKLAESGLIFLVVVHLLGGLRLLIVENLSWSGRQRQLATAAAAAAALVAFVFLVRVF